MVLAPCQFLVVITQLRIEIDEAAFQSPLQIDIIALPF
jgi:hypothetical protein